MKAIIFSLLILLSLNVMAEEIDPNNCFYVAHIWDANNDTQPASRPLVIFDGPKTYIFSGTSHTRKVC